MVSGYNFNIGFFAGALDRVVLLLLTFTFGAAGVLYILVRGGYAKAGNNSKI
jgi:hypothetical protein